MTSIGAQLRAMVPGSVPEDHDWDVSVNGALSSIQRSALFRAASRLNPDLSIASLEGVSNFSEVVELVGNPVNIDTSFRGPNVFLRPIVAEDYKSIYYSWLEPDRNLRWRLRGRTPSFDEFLQVLYAGVLAQFVVCDAQSGESLGLVVAYDHHPAPGHCKIGYCGLGPIDRKGQRRATTAGLMLLVDYVFRSFALNKIYFEVPSYNDKMVDGLDDLLDCEATLTDHLVFDGRLTSLRVLSLSKANWRALAEVWFE